MIVRGIRYEHDVVLDAPANPGPVMGSHRTYVEDGRAVSKECVRLAICDRNRCFRRAARSDPLLEQLVQFRRRGQVGVDVRLDSG